MTLRKLLFVTICMSPLLFFGNVKHHKKMNSESKIDQLLKKSHNDPYEISVEGVWNGVDGCIASNVVNCASFTFTPESSIKDDSYFQQFENNLVKSGYDFTIKKLSNKKIYEASKNKTLSYYVFDNTN